MMRLDDPVGAAQRVTRAQWGDLHSSKQLLRGKNKGVAVTAEKAECEGNEGRLFLSEKNSECGKKLLV